MAPIPDIHSSSAETDEIVLVSDSPKGNRIWHLCSRALRGLLPLPKTHVEAERERRVYGTHTTLTGMPTTADPDCDIVKEATIRR